MALGHAATKYWIGPAGGNFTTNANWTTTAGSGSGMNANTTAPGASDIATFTGDCTFDAVIASPVSVAGIDMVAGYTGTVTQNAGVTVTMGGSGHVQAGGTFAGGNSAIGINGAFTLNGGIFTSTSGTVTSSGNWSVNGGTFNHNGGTVQFFNGSGQALTLTGSQTLNHVTIGGPWFSDTLTLAGGTTLTVNGTLNLAGSFASGQVTVNGGTIVAQGNIVQGSIAARGTTALSIAGTGAQTLTGGGAAASLLPVTINKSAGTLTLAGTIATQANWTYTAGTLNPGTSTVQFFNSSSQALTLTGSQTLNHVTIGGPWFSDTLTLAGGTTLTVNGTLNLAGSFANGQVTVNGGAIVAQGNIVHATVGATGSTGVTFSGTGAQTWSSSGGRIPGSVVTVNKSSGKVTLGSDVSAITAGQGLTLSSGTVALAGYNLTVNSTLTVAAGGTLQLFGSETVTAASKSFESGSTVTYTGDGDAAADSYILSTLVATFSNLRIDSTDGVTDTYSLGTDIQVDGTLTFTNGNIVTGANSVVISASGSVARSSGHVIGNLQKNVATGSGVSRSFEVGDASVYGPVTATFANVTTAGNLTAKTTPGAHPNIASAGFVTNKKINRSWSLTNGGVVFSTYDATFNFVAGDSDAGTDTAVLVARNYSGGWFPVVTGLRNATNTQATGLTSFGDFALGEISGQTIGFGALTNRTFGSAPFSVSATSSSGLPVSFTSMTPSVCIVSGSTVTIIAAGSGTIRASQAGNSSYPAAPDVDQSFSVGKATATVTLGGLSAIYDGTAKTASATTASPSGLTVTVTYDGSATAPSAAGSYAVVGTIGDSNYQGSASGTLIVAKANQAIAFGALGAKTFGEGVFAVSATSNSGLAPTYSIVSGPATIGGSAVTLTGAGTVVVRAMQAGNANYNAAPDVNQSFSVAKATATVTLGGLSATYDGTAKTASATTASPSGLTVMLTYDGSGTAPTDAGSYTVVGTIGDANYAGSASGTLSIAKAAQTISFNPVTGMTYGDVPFVVSATASSSLSVSFSIVGGPATLSGNTVTITGAGSVTVRASQAGDTNYLAATGVDQVFTVGKSNQSIGFGALSGVTYGDVPFAVSATASSGLAPTYTIASGPATISGNTVTISGAGSVTVRASQSGNLNYNAAPDVDQILTVGKANQATTFGALAPKTFGHPAFAVSATANSGLTVSFSVLSGPATILGTIVTITGAGTVVIRAAQNGNGNTNAAPNVDQSFAVAKATAAVTLGSLASLYNGAAKSATAITSPAGLTVNFTYNGFATVPINVGSYAVIATVSDANYTGSTSGTLAIGKGAATVTLGNLGATYDGATKAVTATTVPGGMSVSVTYNGSPAVPRNAGTYAIVATISDSNYTGFVTGTHAIVPASQTISFGALAGRTFGNAPFALSATASSGLPVNFNIIGGPANVSGGTVTLTGAGSVIVRASQTGDANILASPTVDQSFVVAKAAATVTLGNLSATYDGTAKNASATTANPSGLIVTLTYDDSATAPSAAGSYAVVGSIADSNYRGSASGSLVIAKANQTIAFGALGAKTYGDAAFAVSATANSGLAPTYSIVGGPATIGGSTVTLTGAGTVVVRAAQSGDANYNPATPVDQSFAVAKAAATVTLGSLSATYDGSSKGASATTSPASLRVGFTYNGSAAAPTDAGTYTVVGTIDDSNYRGSASGTLAIGKGAATVTLGNVGATYDGTTKAVTATTVPGGMSVSVTYNGSSAVPKDAGSYAILATISDPNYTGFAAGTHAIAPASQTISFGALAPRTFGNEPFALSATASSRLPVSFVIASGPAGVSGGTVTLTGAGRVIVRASQTGDANTLASPPVDQSFMVANAPAAVTLGNLSATYDGAAKSVTATTVPAGLSMVFTYSGSATVPTAAGSYAVVGSVVDANYAGSSLGTLVIARALATVTLGNLIQTADGTAKTISTVTSPAGLSVAVTYNGSATPPSVAGSYAVTATVTNANYQGSASDTLLLASAPPPSAESSPGTTTGASQIFFGSLGAAGFFAMEVNRDQGRLLGYLPEEERGFAVRFTVAPDGGFRISVTMSGVRNAAGLSALAVERVMSGRIVDGRLNGLLETTGDAFNALNQSPSGPAAAFAGYYESALLNTADGSTSWIVGASGRIVAVTISSTGTEVATGAVGAGGSFVGDSSAGTHVSGTMAADGVLQGVMRRRDGIAQQFAGLKITVLRSDRLTNISSRAWVGASDKIMIAGFAIAGPTPKTVLIRAVGPGLDAFGVNGFLANPTLAIYRGSDPIASNDDWHDSDRAGAVAALSARVGAFGLSAGSKDSAVIATLDPGSYTAQVRGAADGTSGVALVEVYDASANPGAEAPKKLNISTRGEAGTGDNILIAGFVVTGNSPKKVLIRAVGPGLSRFGVGGVLVNPALTLYSGGTEVARDDDWYDSSDARSIAAAATQIGAFALESASKDAALLTTLAPGAYSVHVTGVADTTGVALIEVYDVP